MGSDQLGLGAFSFHTMTNAAFNPRTPEFANCANDQFSHMRTRGAVFSELYQKKKIHHVFTYDAVSEGLRDDLRWSSQIDLFEDLLLGDAAILIQDDPPRHTKLRGCLMPWIRTQTSVVKKQLKENLFNPLSGVGAQSLFDAVKFGEDAKNHFLKLMFGLQDEHIEALSSWSQVFGGGVGLEFLEFEGPRVDSQRQFVREMHVQLDRILDRILSASSLQIRSYEATVSGELRPEETRALLKSLLFASSHTLAHQIPNTIFLLIAEAEIAAFALCGETNFNRLIDEAIRVKPVFRGSHRVAAADFSFHGAEIHKGDYGVFWATSANHDTNFFPQGSKIDIDRYRSGHLSFGTGIHRCVGAVAAQFCISHFAQEFLTLSPRSKVIRSKPSADPWVDAFEELILEKLP